MKLLFICTHNRCRSILGEAIARHMGGTNLVVASAGSAPQGEVHPLTLKYLSEKGISIENLRSQSWHEFEDFEPDVVLTMCDNAAKEVCPVWFDESIQINWALKDPSKNNTDAKQQRIAFYKTMEIIEQRIEALLSLHADKLTDSQLESEFNRIAANIC